MQSILREEPQTTEEGRGFTLELCKHALLKQKPS